METSKKEGGLPKKIAAPESLSNDIREIAQAVFSTTSKDNSSATQRERVLKSLTMAGSHGVTTIQFRESLDIMAPAQRVYELRGSGYSILTIWDDSVNAQDNKHRNARYVLINSAPSDFKEAA